MDRSRQNNTNLGYVQNNVDSPITTPPKIQQLQMDGPDFLPFSDSPQINQFSPNYYSSPQPKFYKKTPRNYPPNRRWNHRWSNNNFKSRNNSFNQNKSVVRDEKDFTKFIHPSFLEDPWAKLEAKFKKSQQESEDGRVNDNST